MTRDDDPDRFTLEEMLQRHVDMSGYESQVYLALVRGGKQTMKEIADGSGVPKQRVYDVVETLIDRGFVELDGSYPKQAYAVEPTRKLGPIQQQIEETQARLEDLHESIADDDSPITYLDNQSTIDKYVSGLLDGAENTVFLMTSPERLSQYWSHLESREDVQVRLIVSDLDRTDFQDGTVSLSQPVTEIADHVRGMTRSEPFIMSIDRRRGIFWPDTPGQGGQAQGAFHITDGELSFVLDRFLSDTMWQFAYPATPDEEQAAPSLPAQYFRIRDCLADVSRLTADRPLESLSVAFEGYERTSEEQVSGVGLLSGFYDAEFEQSYLELEDVTIDGDAFGQATIGGWRSEEVDFMGHWFEVRDRPDWSADVLDSETRSHIETCLLEFPETASEANVVVGFEGFIDHILELVDERKSTRMYDTIDTIDALREIFERESSGATYHFEWVEKDQKPGGHAAHAGRSYDKLGYDLTAIGYFGHPIHEEFDSLLTDETMISLGQPAETQYLQFDDGKVLFTGSDRHETLNWEILSEYLRVDRLVEYLDEAELVSIGGWALIPEIATIWEGIREEVYPQLSDPPSDVLVKATDMDRLRETTLRSDIEGLAALDDRISVTVVMTFKQARHLDQVLLESSGEKRALSNVADDLQQELGVSRVAITGERKAVLATGRESLRVNSPRIEDAAEGGTFEDHFAAGLGMGCIEGLSDAGELALASAFIGVYQSNRQSGELAEVRSFLEEHEDTWAP